MLNKIILRTLSQAHFFQTTWCNQAKLFKLIWIDWEQSFPSLVKKLQMKFIMQAFMFEVSKILKSCRWDNIQRKFMRHGKNHLGSLNLGKTSSMMKSTWMAKITFSSLINSTCFCITIMESKSHIIWHYHFFLLIFLFDLSILMNVCYFSFVLNKFSIIHTRLFGILYICRSYLHKKVSPICICELLNY